MALPILQIRLLGQFSLVYGDAPVLTIGSPRLHALLAYLLLHRDAPQPRQHLAYLFWPDATDMQARNNLRQMLHQLRQVLPDAERFLYSDTSTLRWHQNAAFSLDIATFEHALDQANEAEQRQDRGRQRDALEAAVSIYRDDLLTNCYDEWIAPERERLRQRYLGALATLAHMLEAQRDYAAAIRHAQSWIRHDSLAEDAYRALMRLLAQANDRAGALRVYRACARILRHELGVEPSAATRDIYERLRQVEVLPANGSERGEATPALPALIGRQQEWEALQSVWQQANAGQPRFALVTGEAGIGKSRLAEELLDWASRHGMAVARTRSYAAEGRLSLAPVSDLLRNDRIRPLLASLEAIWLTEVSRILPEVLAEHADLPRPEPVTEYGQRQRFFEALARALLAGQPLMILIDDLQWCDQETLEWLHFLLRFDRTARLLVVGTARDEGLQADHPLRGFLLHLGNTVGLLEIPLQPLDAQETARLAAQVVGRELDIETVLRLYQQTEGNPLFVVETVRAGLSPVPEHDPGSSPLDARAASPPLPPRVYAVIAGRLAQLSASAGEIVELAAAIGRAFSLEILLRAGHGDEERVVRALDELWNKRIVREQGANAYDFTHDKLREVAYAEISAPQRRLHHRRIAQALEAANAEDIEPVNSQIAFHYEHAGMAEQAIPYYRRAAAVAQRVYANDDAIGLLSRGLGLIEYLPAGTKRDTQELGMLLSLVPALRVTRGWTAPEAEQALDRALVLCDTVGDDERRMQVLNGLVSVYVVQARFDEVEHLSERLSALYQRSVGTAPPLFTGVMVNGSRMHRGNLTEANERFTELIAAEDPEQMRRVQDDHSVNYMVHARAWQGHVLWCLGYPGAALTSARDALQLARDLAQPFNQALAAAYLATLMQLCADDAAASAAAEEALALATEFKALYYRAWAAVLVDFARAWDQPDAERITRLRGSIAAFTVSGARIRLPYFLSLLARVHAKAGHADEGLAVLDEALAAARAQNEHWWDAELHRLRGELLLACDGQEQDAEAAMLRAIEIARAQRARSLELRAATSLARLRISQRRSEEGRQLLAELLTIHTEGLDTPDLLAARTLLARTV